jgi:hypothetical protein
MTQQPVKQRDQSSELFNLGREASLLVRLLSYPNIRAEVFPRNL